VVGPVGAGKTKCLGLSRDLAVSATGRIEMPARARSLFPAASIPAIGTLRDAVAYPASSRYIFRRDHPRGAAALELGRLETHLDETAQWEQQLTVDEQQRLTIARVSSTKPTGSS